MVAVVTLLASDLLGSDRFAGVASASFTAGIALTAPAIAPVMRRRGRRPGLIGALAVGTIGSAIAAVGGQSGSFLLFLAGMALFGSGHAATLQSRYVAADLAEPAQQARAIGAVVWLGAVGAGIGPLLTPIEKRAADGLGLEPLVGPFLFAVVFFGMSALLLWLLLRPDPLVVAGGVDPSAGRPRPLRSLRASAGIIMGSSGALLGLAAMTVSQTTMVAVMTMTPAHMKDHGHSDLSAFVIAVHIVGMFGLAPLVGRVVDRVGPVKAIRFGAIVLGVGTASSVVAGYQPALIFVGLFLLGLGWNIGLISGTTLFSSSIRAEHRVEAQGSGDLVVSMCGALGAISSGLIKEAAGFHTLANAATVFAAVLLFAALRRTSVATPVYPLATTGPGGDPAPVPPAAGS